VEVFNNTLYDCGANTSRNAEGSHGAFSVGDAPQQLVMRLRNNLVYQLPGEVYLDGSRAQIVGEQNLWYGAGDAPSQTSNNLGDDPQFVNLRGFDFHLREGSPAREAGATVLPNNPFSLGAGTATDRAGAGQATDIDGVARPQGKAFAIGAYEVPR